MSLSQPPEGVLDPKQPWYNAKVGEKTWIILKAKLTGGEAFGTGYSSTVNLTSADADKLIENLKKDPRGYPQMNNGGGGRDTYDNIIKYQEWLREEYLEKPFRKQLDAKIEEAAIESRMKEIEAEREQEKLKELKKEKQKKLKEEQAVLDADQKAIEEKTTEITEELDSVEEEKKPTENQNPAEIPEEPETNKLSSDIQAISDSLVTIKGSLTHQISDMGAIQRDSIKSLSALEGIKPLFQAQTDIIKREVDSSEKKISESGLEKTQNVSDTSKSTDLTADNKAEGIIQGIDGPTITIKTTEGEFKEGQKITQGGGGGGLFDMLKGIAGKFMGGGKGAAGTGGGASPLKMSSGGIATGPTKLAGGAFSPGVYNKPTRGNLGPGQAVVPLNRNIGKKMFPDKMTQTLKLQQPLADVMAQPLKAIGLSILSVTGNFLRLLGPLAGFFTPYIGGLVKGFAGVLGVPVNIITSLLGGPAYAAMEDQERQQNVFAKLWASLMDKFGFSSSDESGEDKKEKTDDDDTPADFPPGAQGLLDFIASKESGGDYTKIFGGSSIAGLTDKTIEEVVQIQKAHLRKGFESAAIGKYQIMLPDEYGRKAGLNISKDKFSKVNQDKMGMVFLKESGWDDFKSGKMSEDTFADNVAWVWAALPLRSGKSAYAGVGSNASLVGRQKFMAQIRASKTSAESGITTSDSSMGKMLGWSIVEGPNSGYDVNPNLEMHGEEAYLQYENGFTVLPIENRKFSLSKKPKETLDRWEELINSGDSNKTSYETGGVFKNNFLGSKSKGLSGGTKASAGFTGMGKIGFDAIQNGAKYIASKKAQILGRGAYSAPTMSGAMRYAGGSGSLGGKQTPGGVIKTIVPGGARRLNFLEPQSKVSGEIFDKGKALADKLMQGKYANSALANKLREQLSGGYVAKALTPLGSTLKGFAKLLKLAGKVSGVASVVTELAFPDPIGSYQEVSGPNAYYNAPGYKPVKPSVTATGNKPRDNNTLLISSPPQQISRTIISPPSSSQSAPTIIQQSRSIKEDMILLRELNLV